MAFTFTTEQRDIVLRALGKDDSAAWHLTEDIEAAIDAYGRGSREASGADLRDELQQVSALATALRSALYPLPENLHRSGLVGDLDGDLLASLGRHAERLGESLDQFTLEIADLRSRIALAHSGLVAPAERFVHALGQAYRNRLNIRPTSAPTGQFRLFLEAVIELVRRRHSDLDELAGFLSDERLSSILETGHS